MTPKTKLLTTGQVARRLGWHVVTVRRRCRSGDIPHVIVGTRTWISSEWLESVLAEIKKTRTSAHKDAPTEQ